jgi:hypothetical protein
MLKLTKNKIYDIVSIAIIFLSISFLTFLGIYGTPFNIDFVVLFSGAYSIIQGVFPYVHFPLPPFPFPFFLQAFFQLILGSNLKAMMMHSIFLSSILCISFYYLSKKYLGRFFAVILAMFLHYAFIGIITYPWYNQHALLFLFLNIFLLIKDLFKKVSPKVIFILSYLLVFLGIISKTDIGLLHFIGVSLYFLYSYRDNLRGALRYFYIPVIISSLLFNILLKIIFSSQNIGLSTSGTIVLRISKLFSILSLEKVLTSHYPYFVGFLLIFVITLGINFKNQNSSLNKLILIAGISNMIMCGIIFLSGHTTQNKFAFVPVNLFLLFIFTRAKLPKETENLKEKKITLIFLFLIFSALFLGLSYVTHYDSGQHKSPTQQFKYIFMDSPSYEREATGCYSGQLFEKEESEALNRLRSHLGENTTFIVSGQFTFLYCDYGETPPKNLPLWFHEGVTISSENFPQISQEISKEAPEIFIEQFYGSTNLSNFSMSLKKHGYEQLSKIYIEKWNRNITTYKL